MARFLQLSDLHVVGEGARASGVLDTRAILKTAVNRLIDMRDALGPIDAVLVTGDISDDGCADSYSFARDELNRLALPLLIVPGNHDIRGPFRAAFAGLVDMPSSGLIDWATFVGDTLVIGLDTLIEGQSSGRLRDESLDLLKKALASAGTGPVIVMLHHPPIQTGIRFMDSIGLENTTSLEPILDEAQGEVTLLAGHVHGVHHGRLGRHHVVTAPSICSAFALDRRSDAPVGFLTGPTGCAVIDTCTGGAWSAVSLDQATGPFPF